MDRAKYNACVSQGLKGKQLGKDERKLEFCIVAKGCAKGLSREEATSICSLPKPPKEPRVKKPRGSKIDAGTLATCVIKGLDGSDPTLANLPPIIASCTGQKAGPTTREKFIKKCFKENSVTGDIKEAQKLRSFCTARWKEQGAAL